MSLGIGLEDALVMSTRNPAAVLTSSLPLLGGGSAEGDGGLERMLGCMAPGTHADLTLLRVHEGEWEFIDGAGNINIGNHALEPVSCIRAGQVMPIDYGPREGGWLPNQESACPLSRSAGEG